jgi:hypothetical protein
MGTMGGGSGLEPGPAVRQADALLTELRYILTVYSGKWNKYTMRRPHIVCLLNPPDLSLVSYQSDNKF